MFFYENVDWIGMADSLSPYFGEGGVIIAGILKMISILIISPLMFIGPIVVVTLIITKFRRRRHARKIQKLLGNLQRKCKLIKTTSKHSFKHQL